jgi:hypothetical protein
MMFFGVQSGQYDADPRCLHRRDAAERAHPLRLGRLATLAGSPMPSAVSEPQEPNAEDELQHSHPRSRLTGVAGVSGTRDSEDYEADGDEAENPPCHEGRCVSSSSIPDEYEDDRCDRRGA